MKDVHVTLKPPERSTTKHAQQYWVFDGLVGSANLNQRKRVTTIVINSFVLSQIFSVSVFSHNAGQYPRGRK